MTNIYAHGFKIQRYLRLFQKNDWGVHDSVKHPKKGCPIFGFYWIFINKFQNIVQRGFWFKSPTLTSHPVGVYGDKDERSNFFPSLLIEHLARHFPLSSFPCNNWWTKLCEAPSWEKLRKHINPAFPTQKKVLMNFS